MMPLQGSRVLTSQTKTIPPLRARHGEYRLHFWDLRRARPHQRRKEQPGRRRSANVPSWSRRQRTPRRAPVSLLPRRRATRFGGAEDGLPARTTTTAGGSGCVGGALLPQDSMGGRKHIFRWECLASLSFTFYLGILDTYDSFRSTDPVERKWCLLRLLSYCCRTIIIMCWVERSTGVFSFGFRPRSSGAPIQTS
jgi:hypothetical protein